VPGVQSSDAGTGIIRVGWLDSERGASTDADD
jgi:hypothetical protein